MNEDPGEPEAAGSGETRRAGRRRLAAWLLGVPAAALALCGLSEWSDRSYVAAAAEAHRLAERTRPSASAAARTPAEQPPATDEADGGEDEGDDEDTDTGDDDDLEALFEEDDGGETRDGAGAKDSADEEDGADDDDEDLEDLADDDDDDEGGFDRDDARAALKTSAKKASRCRKRGEAPGRLRIAATFEPTGKVKRIRLVGGYQGTPTGKCIIEKMRATTIEPFEGDPKVVWRAVRVY